MFLILFFIAIFLSLVEILYWVSVLQKPKKIRRTACRFCGHDQKTVGHLNRHERWRCRLRLSQPKPSPMLRLNPDLQGVVDTNSYSGTVLRLEQRNGSCIIIIQKNKKTVIINLIGTKWKLVLEVDDLIKLAAREKNLGHP